jgi:hypothetical protein
MSCEPFQRAFPPASQVERNHGGSQFAESRAWQRLFAVLPVEGLAVQVGDDIAAIAATAGVQVPTYSVSPLYPSEELGRALRRSPGHVLLTGLKGVGKTTHVRELARRAAAGEIPFLAGHRFLWIDCQNVGPEDSRACLESIFTAVGELFPASHATSVDGDNGSLRPERGGNDAGTGRAVQGIVLCLDGLGALLKRPGGCTNKPLLRALISRAGIRLIGILSRWEYNDPHPAAGLLAKLVGRNVRGPTTAMVTGSDYQTGESDPYDSMLAVFLVLIVDEHRTAIDPAVAGD